jgi:hypothetical protein
MRYRKVWPQIDRDFDQYVGWDQPDPRAVETVGGIAYMLIGL